MAVFNTNIAASTGAIGWVLIDYVKHGRRFSVTGVCEGIIAGLVGIPLLLDICQSDVLPQSASSLQLSSRFFRTLTTGLALAKG